MPTLKRRALPIRAYTQFLGVFLLFFIPVYVGGAYVVSQHPERVVRLYFGWETRIPMIEGMVWPYLSLYTVYALPLVHLTADEIHRLSRQSVATLLVAAVVFLTIPTASGFDRHGPGPSLNARVLQLIHGFDTPFNLVPSLHVACAALILLACANRAATTLRMLYLAWLGLLSLSTLLVHQHHVLDVASGLALAAMIRHLIALDGGRPSA